MRYSELACSFETKTEGGDVASFAGVASTSDVDLHNDIIEAGAFQPIALKANNGEPDVLMLRDHDRSQVIGGWKKFEQQGKNLIVEGELLLSVQKAAETYALMKRGYLSGLSVGFMPDKNGVRYDDRNGKRFISKATLKECSIVAMPANTRARVTNVKSELVDLLDLHGLCEVDIEVMRDSGIGEFPIIEKRDPKKPWGDVDYADPGYQDDGVHRYPVHTERNIRAAWSYINMPRNQRPYSAEQLARIKRRIIAAWKDKIDPDGPPSAQDKGEGGDWIPNFLEPPTDEMRAVTAARGLLTQLKGRSHV